MIRFDDYGFKYSGADRPALAGVTLDIPAGQVVSVIAGQGAGKTTLLRAAAGLLGEIYQGEVTGSCHHEPFVAPAPQGKLRAEGSASRRPGAFFDGYVQITLAVETVREEIGLPLYATGTPRPERDSRVLAVARELRIEHLLDREVTALSGGEEKLVGIAAALVPDSRIHVLDEPFEQLDVPHLTAVIRAMKRRSRAGRLVLVATGSVDTAVNIADAGILFDGARWRLVDRPTYEDVAAIAGLSHSSLGEFLRQRTATGAGVRRFRDGVRKVS